MAADPATFKSNYPAVSNVVGGWDGILSNSRQDLDLDDARESESIASNIPTKAIGRFDKRGRSISVIADGCGLPTMTAAADRSNCAIPVSQQSWPKTGAGSALGGSPGRQNSLLQTNLAPMILETKHAPLVPKSTGNHRDLGADSG